jgi:hypothetical protein
MDLRRYVITNDRFGFKADYLRIWSGRTFNCSDGRKREFSQPARFVPRTGRPEFLADFSLFFSVRHKISQDISAMRTSVEMRWLVHGVEQCFAFHFQKIFIQKKSCRPEFLSHGIRKHMLQYLSVYD